MVFLFWCHICIIRCSGIAVAVISGFFFQIRKMDLEARNLQPSVRAGLLAKIREYKSDLNNLKGALKRITSGNPQQGAREELLESGMADALGVCYYLELMNDSYFVVNHAFSC